MCVDFRALKLRFETIIRFLGYIKCGTKLVVRTSSHLFICGLGIIRIESLVGTLTKLSSEHGAE
jgi:hypothetical protein